MMNGTLGHWRQNEEAAYRLAAQWVKENPAAKRLRPSRWQELVSIGAAEATLQGMYEAFRQHLENAESKPEKNRWKNPRLTGSLLKAMHAADQALDSTRPDYVGRAWEDLQQADAATAKAIREKWRREHVWIFLKAVIRAVQGSAMGNGGGKEKDENV